MSGTTRETDLTTLRNRFAETYGRPAKVVVRSPGRVNLIGEHTDYNDGFVLPMATDMAFHVVAAPRDDDVLSATSVALGQRAEVSLASPGDPGEPRWFNYVKGVAVMLQRADVRLSGTDLLIGGDLPVGSGLSSSAALEVGVAEALIALGQGGQDLDDMALSLLCRQAEHEYGGMPCGIMDQFAVTMCRAGHALLLDCRSQLVRHVPVDLTRSAVLIVDSGVKHELAASAYAERVRECREGAKACGPNVGALRDVTMPELDDMHEAGRIDDVIFRRCRHVITENGRAQEAANALAGGYLARFGELMGASHASLRDDYEVSCGELDVLVELAQGCGGVLGARMTGGGFGGCMLALVRRPDLERAKADIQRGYQRACGRQCRFHVTGAASGSRVLR